MKLLLAVLVWAVLVAAQSSQQDLDRLVDQVHSLQIKTAVHESAGHVELVAGVKNLDTRLTRVETKIDGVGVAYAIILAFMSILQVVNHLKVRHLSNGPHPPSKGGS